jgi:hypothetical protein
MPRRLVITICPREAGYVRLPVERGNRPERMNAARLAARLETLVRERGLGERVQIEHACAGGCAGSGPNVSVTVHAMRPPGEPTDHVAVGWKTYVASIATLAYLGAVIDDNLEPDAPATGRSRRRR